MTKRKQVRMLTKRLDKKQKVDLSKFPTDSDGGLDKQAAAKQFATYAAELEALQELLYAAGQNGLLVILQGRDTSGKDGALKAIAGAMNPVGVHIASFKVPTANELAHDFLWRVHAQTPARGDIVFFNRSQYEDVLVARVHELAPRPVWEKRYDDIANFENLLHDAGVIVVKFYLHISKDEQKERLLAREEDLSKAWKLNPGDWAEREYWNAYTTAYEDALGKCAAKDAPWFVVPSDHKWFRNLAIAEALVEILRPYKKAWTEKLDATGKTQKAALAKMREQKRIEKGK